MVKGSGHAPAYNVQTAVDDEHALIVAHKITDTAGDNSLLLPMAEAALEALGHPESLHVVADAGYSNGEQAEACEAQGIVPHVPVTRAVNNREMARCSTATRSTTTRRRTPSAVQRTRH